MRANGLHLIFSSASFLLFFLVTVAFHWYVIPVVVPERHRLRVLHLFLLSASYLFYMSWDWRFGFLMALSTVVDYVAGLYMGRVDAAVERLRAATPASDESRPQRERAELRAARLRHVALLMSVLMNLGILGYFKYADFFIGSFVDFANVLLPGAFSEAQRSSLLLRVILPLGISFFTFQSMSYTIDVYRRVFPAERSFVKFALYVSFFPQLVAGPIVVAKEFLPQLERMPVFDLDRMRVAGRWFALGYLKKVVLADNMAPVVDAIFGDPGAYGPGGTWVGAFGFWVQVYGDISGYSDMAWGTAIFMGYTLPENFNMPYLSRTVTEHWRRWHISLIRWIRDYLYVPLGGNRVSYWRHKRNVFLTMFLAGVWHGANWTFVLWGTIHGVILTAESIFRQWASGPERRPEQNAPSTADRSGGHAELEPHFGRTWPMRLRIALQLAATTFITIYFGTMFRARNISESWLILKRMLGFDAVGADPVTSTMLRTVMLGSLAIILGHILGHYIFQRKWRPNIPAWAELAATPLVVLLFIQLGTSDVSPFIYFTF